MDLIDVTRSPTIEYKSRLSERMPMLTVECPAEMPICGSNPAEFASTKDPKLSLYLAVAVPSP